MCWGLRRSVRDHPAAGDVRACAAAPGSPPLPYQRTAEVLNERAGLTISPGTLQRAVRVAAARLEAPVTAIRDALVAAPVAPCR